MLRNAYLVLGLALCSAACDSRATPDGGAGPDVPTRTDVPAGTDAAPLVTNPYPAECTAQFHPAGGLVDEEDPDAGVAADASFCPAASGSMRCPDRVEAPACFFDPRAVVPTTRCPLPATPVPIRVLLFAREEGWCPHPAHCAAEHGLLECGARRGWTVDLTADTADINTPNLMRYDALVYLMTGPQALTSPDATRHAALAPARDALQAFVHAGRGFAAVHSVTATDTSWDWFRALLGASFAGHPDHVIPAALHLADRADPLLAGLPDPWVHCEELHTFTSNPADNPALHVLVTYDEDCPPYTVTRLGVHPVAWRQTYEGARVFVTSLGHTAEAYNQAAFLRHVTQGIEWTAGH